MTTVRELADVLGISKSTLMRFCKDELGLRPEPRKVLQLDAVATAACCSRFGDCVRGGSSSTSNDESTASSLLQLDAVDSVVKLQHAAADDAADDAVDSVVTQEVARLMAQVARLEAERDAADARARQYRDEIDRLIAEHDKERADNAAARAQLAGALESAEQKAARAEAEASSYRPSLFGFYRKGDTSRLEG